MSFESDASIFLNTFAEGKGPCMITMMDLTENGNAAVVTEYDGDLPPIKKQYKLSYNEQNEIITEEL